MILDVLGDKWKLRFVSVAMDPETGEPVAGYCHFIKKELVVSTAYPELSESDRSFQIFNTVLHELKHATHHVAEMRDQHWFNIDSEHLIIAPQSRVEAINMLKIVDGLRKKEII